MARDSGSATRDKRRTTPVPVALQDPADTPIIALDGLLRLAVWIHAHHSVVQGGQPCHELPQSLLPPAPPLVGPSRLDQLWSLLTDEQRQRTLVTLSGIVVRQLDAPRDDGEVRDDPLITQVTIKP